MSRTVPDRLGLLLGAALELASPHDRDTVLQSIVEGAAKMVDARFAALGVYDEAGVPTTFVHHGIDETSIEAIGHYPLGDEELAEPAVVDGAAGERRQRTSTSRRARTRRRARR